MLIFFGTIDVWFPKWLGFTPIDICNFWHLPLLFLAYLILKIINICLHWSKHDNPNEKLFIFGLCIQKKIRFFFYFRQFLWKFWVQVGAVAWWQISGTLKVWIGLSVRNAMCQLFIMRNNYANMPRSIMANMNYFVYQYGQINKPKFNYEKHEIPCVSYNEQQLFQASNVPRALMTKFWV